MNNSHNISTLLQKREVGTKSQYILSLAILRQLMFSSKRKWVLVNRGRYSSNLEFNYDTLWISRFCKDGESQAICSHMKRIKIDGSLQNLYEIKSTSSIKEVILYDLPDPVFKSTNPDYEYQPTLCVLRKDNTLSRYNMLNGKFYDSRHLGPVNFKDLTWNATLDQLVLSTSKLRNEQMGHSFIIFKIFNLHPFKFFSSFVITSKIFPFKDQSNHFGRLRNAEIVGSFLLVMTVKNYSLLYSLEDILKQIASCRTLNQRPITNDDSPYVLETAPPLLFYTQTHFNILSFGGFPWMYIRSLSNNLLEIRKISNGDLLRNGKISFDYAFEQKVLPDNVTFHMDESNRIIHFSNCDLRILRIKELNGELCLQKEFQYNEVSTTTSEKIEGVELSRVTFYDVSSYKLLHTLPISVIEHGDLETNTFMIYMDKDVLNIVTKSSGMHRYLSYRLSYDYPNLTVCENKQFYGPFSDSLNDQRSPRASRTNRRIRRRAMSDMSLSDDEWDP